MSRAGEAGVFPDPIASPNGFPFKVLQMEDTHSVTAIYEKRERVCDLKYLHHAYKTSDSSIRCFFWTVSLF